MPDTRTQTETQSLRQTCPQSVHFPDVLERLKLRKQRARRARRPWVHGSDTEMFSRWRLQTLSTVPSVHPAFVTPAPRPAVSDISNISHVISYDLPSDMDDYVHHIGRTGHAENTGVSTAFFDRGSKDVVRDLLEFLREANQEISA
ncbi:hypothetical protein CY34DRAFT_13730 [Suillus luteus UH-Slu-Lm8-n1]|uniref:Helicase C-terminal domain-containing protein n=1 Tax=Suillus luteus UH-Slu-Lm8-n1 TaxID=930992 RepID=A0A0D0AQW0_9AGAM|nr:hypothetical protein CY34DRAFT_13730 [Suillus luteus UH-Slu-Lm8-n1]